MNNTARLNVSSISVSTLVSMSASLRWLRRAMTLILILSNLAITIWANAPR